MYILIKKAVGNTAGALLYDRELGREQGTSSPKLLPGIYWEDGRELVENVTGNRRGERRQGRYVRNGVRNGGVTAGFYVVFAGGVHVSACTQLAC